MTKDDEQCQAVIQLHDPARKHPGYARYLENRQRKAERHGWDWHLCQRTASYRVAGQCMCRIHAGLHIVTELEKSA